MDVIEADAPGRLDILGGVGDYSGCFVLEAATILKTTCRARILEEEAILRLTSDPFGRVEVPIGVLVDEEGKARDEKDVRAKVDEMETPSWAKYGIGCVLMYLIGSTRSLPAGSGLELTYSSTLPSNQGVSSSAAVEVSTLRVMDKLLSGGGDMDPVELAKLGQRAENRIVGASCGLMDQLASSLGEPGTLLPIQCRPDICYPKLVLPEEVCVVGWPSGVKHEVSGEEYGHARTSAFIAKKLVQTHGLQLPLAASRHNTSITEFPPLEYLAQLTPSEVERRIIPRLPTEISGADFLAECGTVDDDLSHVHPDKVYQVHAALRFVAGENDRAQTAIQLLRNQLVSHEALIRIGSLMGQSHAAYTAIGLGTPQTDEIVDVLETLGPERGVYGARVSGGGCGGTVVVLCKKEALEKIQEIAKLPEYQFWDAPFEKLIQ